MRSNLKRDKDIFFKMQNVRVISLLIGVLLIAYLTKQNTLLYLFVVYAILEFFFYSKKKIRQVSNIFSYSIFSYLLFAIIKLTGIGIYHVPSRSMENTIQVDDWILVNKLSYGSYLWFGEKPIKLPSLSKIMINDILVFHAPEGDTIYIDYPQRNFYELNRLQEKNDDINILGDKLFIRTQFRQPYVKRCAALPGSRVQIKNSLLYVDSVLINLQNESRKHFIINDAENQQTRRVYHTDSPNITQNNSIVVSGNNMLQSFIGKTKVPFQNENWTIDNWGPVLIPKKGEVVQLTNENIHIYKRIIINYEKNSLEEIDGDFRINGIMTNEYMFKQNYYFMLGDNWYYSSDSRFWGCLPEDHVIGKTICILGSKKTAKSWWKISSYDFQRFFVKTN